jgi:hypothetical protein
MVIGGRVTEHVCARVTMTWVLGFAAVGCCRAESTLQAEVPRQSGERPRQQSNDNVAPAGEKAPDAEPSETETAAEQDSDGRVPVEPKLECRIEACGHRLLYAGDPPGGWRGTLEAELCIETDCTKKEVELSQLQTVKQQDGKVWFVVTGPDGCSTEFNGDCSSLRQALKMVPNGGRKLVIGTAFGPGDQKLYRTSFTVRRAGKILLSIEDEVTFDGSDGAQYCYRPNGPRCEPECCEAVREF